MQDHHWQALQDLFMQARAVQGEERERLLRGYLDSDPALVERVRSLLAADAEPGIMDALAARLIPVSNLLQDVAPERVGPYRIVSELGRGGMGVVYLAERADGQFQQRVAIKLIASADADDPLHQRFLAERQILADLVHPNIARLLDGGLTDDGRPYLVLEYVDGLPITTYCECRQLDIRARLRLFADVCAAVQHAHRSLVIHRDLKPSNILVSSDARVHLLDFGIAKLLGPTIAAAQLPVTRAEWRVMTPEYASPEQVLGESLTTASDIYSLGVLLYELMCGQAPYQLTTSSPAQIMAAVCEQDPERPSARAPERLARALRGDLDGIVMMALRKEPDRRYASADMLRQDVERYLAGFPVSAHRGSRRSPHRSPLRFTSERESVARLRR
jgi:serine/threonine-protein kinase